MSKPNPSLGATVLNTRLPAPVQAAIMVGTYVVAPLVALLVALAVLA